MNAQIEVTVEQLLTKIGALVMEIDMLRKALNDVERAAKKNDEAKK